MNYPDLPVRYAPREGAAPVGTLLEVEVDGESSTDVQVGIGDGTRPITTFAPWPGPAKPQLPGSYLVMVTDGVTYEPIGWLIIY